MIKEEMAYWLNGTGFLINPPRHPDHIFFKSEFHPIRFHPVFLVGIRWYVIIWLCFLFKNKHLRQLCSINDANQICCVVYLFFTKYLDNYWLYFIGTSFMLPIWLNSNWCFQLSKITNLWNSNFIFISRCHTLSQYCACSQSKAIFLHKFDALVVTSFKNFDLTANNVFDFFYNHFG